MNKAFILDSIKFLVRIAKYPLLFLALAYGLNYAWDFLAVKYKLNEQLQLDFSFYLVNLMQVIAVYWISVNILKAGTQKLMQWGSYRNYPLLLIIIPPIISSLEGALFLIMVNMLIFSLQLHGGLGLFVDKAAKVLLIVTIAWIFYKIISCLEQYITNKYILSNENLSASRKIQTQLGLLKRVVAFFIGLITFAAVLMVFDSIRGIGTSLLTTAGIISAIGAFASQQSLGRIFAGLQLAFTQPIRIGDTVIIENEFGQVEEITLSFITVKLWDLRRLILPTDYFIQKGVLNLTKSSTDLLGTIFLYADYTLPVKIIRDKFLELVKNSTLWNKQVASLDITDIKEHSMEIRCLVSAANAGDLWKLRCEIREKLIKYIVENHYECLTISRQITVPTIQTESA